MVAITILFFVAAVVFAVLYFSLKFRIVTLKDKMPEKATKRIMVMKLQNELAPFVKKEGEDVVIKVVKP